MSGGNARLLVCVVKGSSERADTICMTTRVFASTWQMPRIANGELVGRIVFVALLVAAPLLPEISSSLFVFPAVNNWWVCLEVVSLAVDVCGGGGV